MRSSPNLVKKLELENTGRAPPGVGSCCLLGCEHLATLGANATRRGKPFHLEMDFLQDDAIARTLKSIRSVTDGSMWAAVADGQRDAGFKPTHRGLSEHVPVTSTTEPRVAEPPVADWQRDAGLKPTQRAVSKHVHFTSTREAAATDWQRAAGLEPTQRGLSEHVQVTSNTEPGHPPRFAGSRLILAETGDEQAAIKQKLTPDGKRWTGDGPLVKRHHHKHHRHKHRHDPS